MTKFEYVTFTLGRLPMPAGKYQKVLDDISCNKDKELVSMLQSVKKDLEKEYSKEELTFTPESELAYWTQLLAKQSAIELLTSGKLSTETLTRVTCLPHDEFLKSVKETTVIATHLNSVIQQAEKSITPDDVIPPEMML